MNYRGSCRLIQSSSPTNGSGAAAILSARHRSFALAVLAMAADKYGKPSRAFSVLYKPTGALSGVTTAANSYLAFNLGRS